MSIVHCAGSAHSKVVGYIEDGIQPNAIDIRLGRVFKILPNVFKIDAQNNKKKRGTEEILPDEDGFWTLPVGEYEILCLETVEVSNDELGLVVTRSTLNRNGCFVYGCVFDSGYKGEMTLRLSVGIAPIEIQKGTRIAQYLSFKSESLKKYSGSYGFGTEDDKIFGKR